MALGEFLKALEPQFDADARLPAPARSGGRPRAARPATAFGLMDFVGFGAAMLFWMIGDCLKSIRLSAPVPILLLPAPSDAARA